MNDRSAEVAIVPMTEIEARRAVATINGHLGSARQLIYDLYRREGWRALGYGSWRECVTAEFEQAERTLYKELNAAQVETIICPMGQTGSIPERQLRPLAPLRDKPAELKQAWSLANERTDGQPTAKVVQAAVDEVIGRREPLPGQAELFGDDEDEQAEEEPPRPFGLKPASNIRSDPEILRDHLLKALDSVDDLTRMVAAKVQHGGYGGLPAVLGFLGRSDSLRLRGKAETLVERLQSWIDSIPEYKP